MRDGLAETIKSADAAKSSAEAAQGALVEARLGREQATRDAQTARELSAAQSEATERQNKIALETTTAQATQALALSTKAAHSEYRPWLVFKPTLIYIPDDFTPDTPPPLDKEVKTLVAGRQIMGAVSLANIGRSPARKIVARIVLRYVETRTPDGIMQKGERAFQEAITADVVRRTTITLAPQQINVTFSNIAPAVPQANVDSINNGIGGFILAGEVMR
ncbi:MAG: hypothetical protein ABSG41_15020 [Bryobacteraceae bacterium]